ncbi:preprotein translocase subunit YajC [Crenobacter cavernae]|uniref:Sec translocon accessory complex subunit YajC n=1 Tax=Crenobacter cavernae TaxID=2290923 RepID=A0ABY0FGJ4_9NEIS|nr:preprotein translocase subunit YajC [Crenobacter cavernae]RXZ45430.1 preprotein translocase subunit YajC [Crenobacter cavernae]
MFITPAYAATGPAGFDLSTVMGFLPMIAIFAVFWLLLIRPQQKKMKEHQKMLSVLEKGDEVVTQGGVAGRVTKVGEAFLAVEIANGVEVQVQRSAVSGKLEKGTLKSL